MKKTKLLSVSVSVLIVCFMLGACGTAAPTEAPTEKAEATTPVPTTPVPTTPAPTAEPTTEAPTTAARPMADGQSVEAYDLLAFLPSSLEANEYNGMLGVWEYYTDWNTGNKAQGVDITFIVNGAGDGADTDLQKYLLENDDRYVISEFEELELNGFSWLKCTDGTRTAYFAYYNNGVYIITAEPGNDPALLAESLAMLESTLFFGAGE